jgi:hypothetical protein
MNAVLNLKSKTKSRFAQKFISTAKLNLFSNAFFTSSLFSVSMNASLRLYSASSFNGTDQGTLSVDISGDSQVKNEGVIFPVDDSTATLSTTIPDRVDLACCSFPLPVRLELRHDIVLIEQFKFFLSRNGFIVPGDISNGATTSSFVPLYYSERVGSYLGQLHYNGSSSDSVGTESWSFSFELACNDLTNPKTSWQFTMLAKVFFAGRAATIRLSSTYNTSQVCTADPLFFAFVIDTIRDISVPDAALGLIFHDEDGMVTNSVNPFGLLHFSISVPDAGGTRQTFPWSLDEQMKATLPPLL